MSKEIAVEWVECPQCEGTEGWNGENDEWYDCPMCEGAGGWNQEVLPDQPSGRADNE